MPHFDLKELLMTVGYIGVFIDSPRNSKIQKHQIELLFGKALSCF